MMMMCTDNEIEDCPGFLVNISLKLQKISPYHQIIDKATTKNKNTLIDQKIPSRFKIFQAHIHATSIREFRPAFDVILLPKQFHANTRLCKDQSDLCETTEDRGE
jgi:hypothetical protein